MSRARRIELAPGYEISRIVVGGWQLSAGHHADAPGPEEALDRLAELVDLGLDTFDCGDIYTGVEALFGRLLARRRATSATANRLRIHTKLVPDLSALEEVDRRYVERIVDRSLGRLGVEALDLLQLHWWDMARGDWLAAASVLGDLVRAGKVRRLGATNVSAAEARAMADAAGVPLVSVQAQYSVLDRRPEATLASWCASRSTGILAYGTLAGGLLTSSRLGAGPPVGVPSSRSLVKYGLIVEEFGGWDAYQAVLAELDAIGRTHGVDAGTVALRFVLDQPGVAAAIVGFADAERMRGTLRALDLELSAEDHARIRALTEAAPGPAGEVYALERDREGPHGRIMRYEQNRSGEA